MLKDRGSLKWSMSMMLPEHVRALREWQAEDEFVERPELSEWDLMEIEEEVGTAMKRRCQTEVHTWRSGEIHTHSGVIEYVDTARKRIRMDEGWIDIGDVVAVKMLE